MLDAGRPGGLWPAASMSVSQGTVTPRSPGHLAGFVAGILAAAPALVLGQALAQEATTGRAAHRFVVDPQPVVFGQAPDWLDRNHIVWHDAMTRDEDGDGQIQIYRSALDGSE